MIQVSEGELTFSFPDGWNVEKVEVWSFYRNQMEPSPNGLRMVCRKCNAETRCSECQTAKCIGAKTVDMVAISPEGIAWLIEVKDYRNHQRIKAIDLADEAAVKACDSLTMLLAAAKQANTESERSFAAKALMAKRFRIVLHLEQRKKPSRLFPRAIDPANIYQRLRKLIRFIDPHPRVVELGKMQGLAWEVA